jgi:hypothetical protein
MKKRIVIVAVLVALVCVAAVLLFAQGFGQSPVYQDENTKIYVKEAVTDGYHIMVSFRIEEKTPKVSWEHLLASCKMKIISEEITFRSRQEISVHSQHVNILENSIDLYFTALDHDIPFESIVLTRLWINGFGIPRELKLAPKMEAVEFIVPSLDEQSGGEYIITDFIASKLGFYCVVRAAGDKAAEFNPAGRRAELHYQDGSVVGVTYNGYSLSPDEWLVFCRYADMAAIDMANVETVEKIIIEGVECLKP